MGLCSARNQTSGFSTGMGTTPDRAPLGLRLWKQKSILGHHHDKGRQAFGRKIRLQLVLIIGYKQGADLLRKTWELNADGSFDRPKDTTAGTLVVSSDIESIGFFHCA